MRRAKRNRATSGELVAIASVEAARQKIKRDLEALCNEAVMSAEARAVLADEMEESGHADEASLLRGGRVSHARRIKLLADALDSGLIVVEEAEKWAGRRLRRVR